MPEEFTGGDVEAQPDDEAEDPEYPGANQIKYKKPSNFDKKWTVFLVIKI